MTRESETSPDIKVSPLRAEIARQIVQIAKEEAWEPGTRLSDQALAKRLGVSRTPVRAALGMLEAHGMVRSQAGRGYMLAQVSALAQQELPQSQVQQAYTTIRRDRAFSRLPREVSERELIERYDLPRSVILRALTQMASEGLARKQRGHGWIFAETLDTRQSLDESMHFRIVVESAALLEPSFNCDMQEWEQLYAENSQLLASDRIDRAYWLRLNQHFHETLAAWSCNRFFLQAIQQQNHLRNFREQAMAHQIDIERVHSLCREHLGVLDAIREGDLRYASDLMRKHLDSARKRVLTRHDLTELGDLAGMPPKRLKPLTGD